MANVTEVTSIKTKKGGKKSPTTPAAGSAVASTRCDQGKEILTNLITLRTGDSVSLRLLLCKAAFRVIVHLDGNRFAEKDPAEDEMVVNLGPLTPGLHGLSWSYLTNAAAWKVRSEVLVDEIVRFRQRKGDDSDISFNHSFLIMEVQ